MWKIEALAAGFFPDGPRIDSEKTLRTRQGLTVTQASRLDIAFPVLSLRSLPPLVRGKEGQPRCALRFTGQVRRPRPEAQKQRDPEGKPAPSPGPPTATALTLLFVPLCVGS